MQQPHGGKLIHRIEKNKDVSDWEKIHVSNNVAKDIENIAHGVFSPLEGFLCENEYEDVLFHKRLPTDVPWTIPILLDMEEKKYKEGDEVLLESENGMLAAFEIEDIYTYDKKEAAQQVFKTIDAEHPGVKKLCEMGDFLLGGKIALVRDGKSPFENYALSPMETRILFKEKGWKDIVAFQTRNPPHIGHEYVQKTALTFVDGIFINPIMGKKKKGDFTDEIILDSYKALLEHYYLKDRVVLAVLQTEMRYAGPREAIFHAIMRKNFGCTHFIVGRDHAGIGNYYGPYEAHEIFGEFPDLGIIPLFFLSFFYCKKCGSVVNDKVCPHGKEHHINFSGSKIRELLREGKKPPSMMMREEVAEVILRSKNPFVW
ncbi:MAG: sulfate adenylyltransferase [Candidatus Thermoplasmatota archaeon]|nr:sulfate adenylyltransferase [Candidatus Thermoplasmatota archaeon]